MTDTPRAYGAICFDLDGTLLPMDLDAFMGRYFAALYDFMTARGIDGGEFLTALKAGTRAMAVHEDDRTNAEAFWDEFFRHMDRGDADWEGLLGEFYAKDFGRIGADVEPNPAAARAIDALVAKGYPLVLATMPMFPVEAVKWRLRWAGIDPGHFARLTNYENSKAVKPRPVYYAENLAAMGLGGEAVLMVGNNTVEDLAFAELGADAFLVTDWLIDPAGLDLSAVRHGSMADFAAWAETLPACEHPARAIEQGPIDAALTEAALTANRTGGLDARAAAAHAARTADDVMKRAATKEA